MGNTIILIVGLPGSGKTYLANQLSNSNRVFDDITTLDDLPDNDNFVITDVNFCDSKILNIAVNKLNILYPEHEVEIIYFQNDVESCRKNIKYRCEKYNDCRNVEGTIKRFGLIYSPPPDALKIWVASENV